MSVDIAILWRSAMMLFWRLRMFCTVLLALDFITLRTRLQFCQSLVNFWRTRVSSSAFLCRASIHIVLENRRRHKEHVRCSNWTVSAIFFFLPMNFYYFRSSQKVDYDLIFWENVTLTICLINLPTCLLGCNQENPVCKYAIHCKNKNASGDIITPFKFLIVLHNSMDDKILSHILGLKSQLCLCQMGKSSCYSYCGLAP